ncbi:hypothetical protein [Massilia sp.]|uniref:hypothetical protein n=1 Tax=Massilia sp. TaxID=1882437 RepID=UPI0028A0AFBF|nr:hypothetical protein [Massilia sp.]
MSFLRLTALTQIARILSFITVLALSTPLFAHASESIERSVTGEWRLTAALDGAEITSLDERQAKQLLGHVLTINKNKVQFGKTDCGETGFEAQKVEPRLHLRDEFHASSKKLGLPNPVTVVDLSCTSVFIKNRNRLVVFWQGWFFDAVRISN